LCIKFVEIHYLRKSFTLGIPIFECLDPNNFVVKETGCKNIGVGLIQIGPFCEWLADQKFVKSPKIGLRLHTLQIFDLLLRLTEWTNLDDSNASIFYFASSFFYHKIVWISLFKDGAAIRTM
jgi:hypothetical protein